jgi:hypothetical protein
MYSDFEKDVICLRAGRKTSESDRQSSINTDICYPFVTVALELTCLPPGITFAGSEVIVAIAMSALLRCLGQLPALKIMIIVHNTWSQRCADIVSSASFMTRYQANIGGFRDLVDKHLGSDRQLSLSKLPVFRHMTKADFEAAYK